MNSILFEFIFDDFNISTFQHFMMFSLLTHPSNISTFQHFMGSSNISTFQHFNISWAVPTFQHFNISTFYEHIRHTPHRFHISTFQHFNISTFHNSSPTSRLAPPPPRPQVCDSSHPTQHPSTLSGPPLLQSI